MIYFRFNMAFIFMLSLFCKGVTRTLPHKVLVYIIGLKSNLIDWFLILFVGLSHVETKSNHILKNQKLKTFVTIFCSCTRWCICMIRFGFYLKSQSKISFLFRYFLSSNQFCQSIVITLQTHFVATLQRKKKCPLF